MSKATIRAWGLRFCLAQAIIFALLASSDPTAGAPVGKHLVCLGDSLTSGDGDEGGGGFPARLKQKLPGCEVTNLGHSGWTSEMMVKGYEGQPSELSQALSKNPTTALIWIGSNDLWYLYEYTNPTPAEEKADLASYRSNVESAIKALKARGCQVVLALLDDQSRRPVAVRGEAFTGISKAEMQRMPGQVKAYNATLRALAKKHGCGLVDFSASPIFTNPSTLADDGNHPNASGYDKIAAVWMGALK